MELVAPRPNVSLGAAPGGEPVVVFAFPYDAGLVNEMRAIPHRRFDWGAKEWLVPQVEASAPYVADVLGRHPELLVDPEVLAWLGAGPTRWIGRAATRGDDGRGQFVVRTLAGPLPAALEELAVEPLRDGRAVLPFTAQAAETLMATDGLRLSRAALECATRLQVGLDPPRAALVVRESVAGPRLALDLLWDTTAAAAFAALPGLDPTTGTLPIDPWGVDALDAFLGEHRVEVAPSAQGVLDGLRAEATEAAEAIARSQAREAPPPDPLPELHGGQLAPFQWAGVDYVRRARRVLLADEQGLGKTVQALAALELEGAFPAVVVCPASLKLNWEREAGRWLPHRSRAVVSGRGTALAPADLTIVNYDIVADHRHALARRRPRALVLDESHYCKNPRARRTQAVRRLAGALEPDALRLALTGTPVTNRAEEVVPQLRILGRLDEFGSGARLKRAFSGPEAEERLHWHLRRRCLVRRLKRDVLPQLPAKRQVVVPVALANEPEYRLAEEDVIAWLREQPLDLSELQAKVAAALRAERLAQLSALKRLAARGKLAAAAAWIADFRESGEPLVVFAHHNEVLDGLLARFPDAGHLLGRDSTRARDETVRAYQAGEGSGLLICSTLVAGQGITLTRASNVAFLELEWTPALHDQAEDRCHRIGQHDAVTAWYLLAARTIDETVAELVERKRSVVSAVTDGRRGEPEAVVDGVVAALRGAAPVRHLRPVA